MMTLSECQDEIRKATPVANQRKARLQYEEWYPIQYLGYLLGYERALKWMEYKQQKSKRDCT